MEFFKQKTNVNSTGKLLRDILIDEVKNQVIMLENSEKRIDNPFDH
jgi:hypothetical protein